MTLGELLRKSRVKSCLLQSEAADKLGITLQAVSSHERDVKKPSIRTLRKYSDLYGISISRLAKLRDDGKN